METGFCSKSNLQKEPFIILSLYPPGICVHPSRSHEGLKILALTLAIGYERHLWARVAQSYIIHIKCFGTKTLHFTMCILYLLTKTWKRVYLVIDFFLTILDNGTEIQDQQGYKKSSEVLVLSHITCPFGSRSNGSSIHQILFGLGHPCIERIAHLRWHVWNSKN